MKREEIEKVSSAAEPFQRCYIGIDPGKDGALAIIREGGVLVIPFGVEEYRDTLMAFLSGSMAAVCCLEHVSSMPKQGVTSTFNFGVNFGFIQGLLTAYSIPYELVRPQKWKKEFSLSKDKNASIAVCHRLFPSVSLRRTERCTKDHDGMAEALLMAEYARRHL